MAHFAQLDENNKVIKVIVISNDETHDIDGVENEELGIQFCKKLYGEDTKWVQTSFNNNLRGNFAGIEDTYNYELDVFIPATRGELIESKVIAELEPEVTAAEATKEVK